VFVYFTVEISSVFILYIIGKLILCVIYNGVRYCVFTIQHRKALFVCNIYFRESLCVLYIIGSKVCVYSTVERDNIFLLYILEAICLYIIEKIFLY